MASKQEDQYHKQFELFLSKLKWSGDSATAKEEPESEDEEAKPKTTAAADTNPESKQKASTGSPPKVGNYICSECNRFFKKKKTLLRHKQLSHAPQTAARTFQTRSTTTPKSEWAQLHQSPSSSNKIRTCPYCNKVFKRVNRWYNYHLEQHRANPGRRRILTVTQTLAAARKMSQDKRRKPKEMEGTEPSDNPPDPPTTATTQSLARKRHQDKKQPMVVVIRTESPETSLPPPTDFTCRICDKKFVLKDRYNRHMSYHQNKKNPTPDIILSDSRCLSCKRSFSNQTELRNHLVLRRNDSKHAFLAHYILSHCFSKLKLAQTPVETFHHLTTNPFSPYDPPSQLLHPKAFTAPLLYSTGKEELTPEQPQNSSSEAMEKGGASGEEAVTDWECGACARYFSCEEDYNSHFLARREDEAHCLVAHYLLAHQ